MKRPLSSITGGIDKPEKLSHVKLTAKTFDDSSESSIKKKFDLYFFECPKFFCLMVNPNKDSNDIKVSKMLNIKKGKVIEVTGVTECGQFYRVCYKDRKGIVLSRNCSRIESDLLDIQFIKSRYGSNKLVRNVKLKKEF